MLRARGIPLSAAAGDRIRRCRDHAQLTGWLQRAATFTKADELFA